MTDLISFVPQATTTSKTDTSKATLSQNFDTFLTILTAQIQNQDPLQPMDSTQFTQQLVQFSGVEQQIKANDQLKTLIASTQANAGASLSGYLGQEAEIDSAGAQFDGSPIHYRYGLGSEAAKATVTITDKSGKVVYSKEGETTKGSHDFIWDGSLNGGGTAAKDDVYYINVVAEDANKKTITPVHSLVTTITGVDLTYGEPALTTGNGVYSYADVKRLTHHAPTVM